MRKLEEYIVKGGRQLRMGYTTGSCAAAAARAAAEMLLTGELVYMVSLKTPSEAVITLDIELQELGENWASCAVQKDAGDDPDATDGIFIHALVRKIPDGIEVTGGRGIGRVTLPGLACKVGEAAINPVPMRMITEQLEAAGKKFGYGGGFSAEIFAPDGEEIARHTFNERLGIAGGISILGTGGIVEPMSEAAIVATIKAEIDQSVALGAKSLLIVPGNYGENFARKELGLSLEHSVKCSNYIGETLDYAVYRGIKKLVLVGHAGKLVKLAAGIMNTHSSVADARAEIITAHAALAGATKAQAQELMRAVTIDAADELLVKWNMAESVWSSITSKVAFQLDYRLKNRAAIEFVAFSKRGVIMEIKNMRNDIIIN